MSRVYESMTRARVGPFTVRVWKNENDFVFGPNRVVKRELGFLHQRSDRYLVVQLPEQIKQILETIPGVNAYEILDAQGDGALVYPDWP